MRNDYPFYEESVMQQHNEQDDIDKSRIMDLWIINNKHDLTR